MSPVVKRKTHSVLGRGRKRRGRYNKHKRDSNKKKKPTLTQESNKKKKPTLTQESVQHHDRDDTLPSDESKLYLEYQKLLAGPVEQDYVIMKPSLFRPPGLCCLGRQRFSKKFLRMMKTGIVWQCQLHQVVSELQ